MPRNKREGIVLKCEIKLLDQNEEEKEKKIQFLKTLRTDLYEVTNEGT